MMYTTPSGKAHGLYMDALKQPHLLIAGATGSGKSVAVNGLIYTALYRFPGDSSGSAQFILIDPKRVELVQYKDLPHTIRYTSEPGEMVDALRFALRMVDIRFKDMQEQRVREYQGGDIYVIIDEFADLMTTEGKAVAPIIQRLGQIGRAAKVHVILCTQCPISKVIPTEIKCNFDARLGLRARSAQDSRNIIGRTCLEKLPRYGKGYYMIPGREGLVDIPMIPESDISARVEWWMRQKRCSA